MKKCPHCHMPVRINELPHPGLFENYRDCPECGGSFTVDSLTKKRHSMALMLMVVMLVLTVLLYLHGGVWLVPAIISYTVFAVFTFRANRALYLVAYGKQASEDES